MTRNEKTLKIAVIGAGNVAWSIAQGLDSLPGHRVVQIVSPTLSRARELAAELNDATGDTPDSLQPDADIYIIAVVDHAVKEIASRFAGYNTDAVWAHTSGSVSIETLAPLGPNIGVFYPMQTFSRGHNVDMETVPFFIEGSTLQVTTTLEQMAMLLSPNVKIISGEDRAILHAAAVIACNFTNHLWAISSEVLNRHGIPFSVMQPLVNETVRKAFAANPDEGQTGPARRGDTATIERHTKLVGQPYDRLYNILSQSIIDRFNNKISK